MSVDSLTVYLWKASIQAAFRRTDALRNVDCYA